MAVEADQARLAEVFMSCGRPPASAHALPDSNGRIRVQPQPVAEVTMEAWYMDDSKEDQRVPHRCGRIKGSRRSSDSKRVQIFSVNLSK